MRAANAVYAQAESHAQICRAICQFADRIAEITAAMNLLFTRAIAACDQLIQEKARRNTLTPTKTSISS